MRLKTFRHFMCLCMTVVLLASVVWLPLPAEAAKTATIPITVGGETFNVTPGQWVTVKTPGGTTSYNVRFVDGKPVALEMSQYQQIIFGDAGSASTAQTGSTGSTSGSTAQSGNPGSTSTGASQTSGSTAQTGNTGSTSTGASQTSGSTAQTGNTGSTSSTAAQTTKPSTSGNTMSWNEFQKANAGKGMSSSEMSQAYKNYKAGNTGTTGTTTGSTGASQTSGSTAQTGNTGTTTGSTGASQTSGSTAQTTPQTSVAEGATTSTTGSTGASQTSGSTAQSTQTGATGTGGTVADSSTAAQSSQGKTSTWDPAKHPRDPQTGQFISHEEAIARGLMDPADATTTTSGSSSSQSAQTAQSGEATQTTGATSGENVQASSAESTASAQTAQSSAEGTAVASEGKTKTSIGDKFKSGYETGKNLTNQGFQNVKDSLKSGFSAKNILVTAGITVGVDLATQVMRGENPSLKTALKTVCCAEFAGSVVGSTLGAAAGSFFTPFLSCIPVVGGVLSALAPTFGSIVGSSAGAYLAGDLKNGRFSIKEAFKRIDWVGVTGQTIGSTAGAALGSFLGPVGTVIGGMVGGYLGNWAAHKIAGLFGKGEANLPTIAMPTGKVGGSSVTPTGSISLGGNSSEISVTISDEMPTSNVEETTSVEEETTSVEASDIDDTKITAAYEEYTTYYSQYNKLMQEGKAAEAVEVAKKMNTAKTKYDSLRYK